MTSDENGVATRADEDINIPGNPPIEKSVPGVLCLLAMDHTHSDFSCWATPKCRHVHDDPFAKRKLPYPLRVTGSVLYNIWPHVLFIGLLSTTIQLINKYAHVSLAISPTLTSVIGFVVALSITFRNQTAYERFTEGRRLWNQLQVVVRNMGRIIWLQVCRFFLGRLIVDSSWERDWSQRHSGESICY